MKKKILVPAVALAVAASLLSTPASWAVTTVGENLDPATNQSDVVFSPDGNTAYVISPWSKSLTELDVDGTTSATEITTFGSAPADLAISVDGVYAFVTLPADDRVAVINLDSRGYTSQILVGDSPFGVAFSPKGDLAYVTNKTDGTVSVINASTRSATSTTITVGGAPGFVEFSPNGELAYVGDYSSGTVSVINTGNNSVTSFSVGNSGVRGIAFSPDGTHAYISHGTDVTAVTVADKLVSDTYDLLDTVGGLAVSPDGSTVFVTLPSMYQMGSIIVATGSIDLFNTFSGPLAAAVSPDGTMTLVANGDSSYLSVFLHNPALAPPITSTSGSTASIAAGSLTASLTDASFPEQTFSHDARYPTTEVILSADDQTGLLSGWNVTLKASDMVWTSPGGSTDANRNLAAYNLSVFLVGDLDIVTTLKGDPFIGGAVTSNTSLDSPVSVLFTEPGDGSGSYNMPLTLQLSLPANAATGTYAGTLTTTISAAP